MNIIATTDQFHMNTYARFPVVFTRGRGTKVWDDDGKEYTDFLSGIGVVNLGHCPPEITEAVCAQADRLVHVSNLFYNEPQARLARKLGRLGGGRCFFANSGAEANEGALKLARRWGKLNFSAEKTGFVTALNSFHGRTLATLAATGQPAKHEAFKPLPAGFRHVEFNDIDALDKAIDDRTCAVILEVIQGEGGVWPADDRYLRAARGLCDAHGAALILDEVQTAMGRTGKFFAFEHFDIRPDIITLAKGLGNGLPIGAVIARSEIAASFKPGEHGSTFGGGPVACAAALAVLEVLEDKGLIQKAAETGVYFKNKLKSLAGRTGKAITDVRGLGLMLGLSLNRASAKEIVRELLGEGYIANNIGDRILRFLPPLIITEGEIDGLVSSLEKALVKYD